jgi:hypothetical protein
MNSRTQEWYTERQKWFIVTPISLISIYYYWWNTFLTRGVTELVNRDFVSHVELHLSLTRCFYSMHTHLTNRQREQRQNRKIIHWIISFDQSRHCWNRWHWMKGPKTDRSPQILKFDSELTDRIRLNSNSATLPSIENHSCQYSMQTDLFDCFLH